MGLKKGKASLVYYGVDIEKFNPLIKGDRKKWGYKENDYIICCPIRLIERKGIFEILKAIQILKNRKIKLFIPTSKLYTPPELEIKVNKLISEYKINNQVKIVFDKVSVFEMPSVYTMSNLMVLPSHIEGLGIVCLESLATKTPVVATNAPGINEVIHEGTTGILAQPRDAESLADKIRWAMENPYLMKKMAENGYELVKKNFEIKKQVKMVEQIYQRYLI